MSGDSKGFIAALDVGTTTIKCHIISSSARSVGYASYIVKLHYPHPGWVEIVPDELFQSVLKVILEAVQNANISVYQIKSIAISTQRCSFITWRKDNGEYLHNFITWMDLRASELIKRLNKSITTTALRWVAYFIYLGTFNKKYGMASKLQVRNNHVSGRLLWVFENVKSVKQALLENNLMFGTVDTWLIYKLTGGMSYVTDITNASSTGFYDPFILDWGIIAKALRIPTNFLPKVVENDYDFGETQKDLFGLPIKIGCVMADQQSSVVGTCSFFEDDLKLTMGTGAFLDVNTAKIIHPSLNGMYPLVGYKIGKELVYISEVPCTDAGSIIQWLLHCGLVDNPKVTSEMALSVGDAKGVFFIPAFSGLGPPINDDQAGTGFIGIKPLTKKEHLVRAVLESIVYQIVKTVDLLKREREGNYSSIKVDGGLSSNDFICQLLADLTDLQIIRLYMSDMAVMGVSFVAGLSCGFWTGKEDFQRHCDVSKTFLPSSDNEHKEKCRFNYNNWLSAVDRFKLWYQK
ncbi:putative glycerol kinase 5 [Diorhabda carinulata]|uniref:putative glycerol kinase 5 n=1 Tax=Diorhabda carinulata TaxID=1163345 RepID=UPI0025A09D4F|nr:putative glycerol kinase 5 [Diorhabda carinulata]